MKLKDCVGLGSTSLPPTLSLSTLNNFVNELIATNSNALSNNMKKTGIVCFKVCNELIYLSIIHELVELCDVADELRGSG